MSVPAQPPATRTTAVTRPIVRHCRARNSADMIRFAASWFDPECAMTFMNDVKNAQDRSGVTPVLDQNHSAWDETKSQAISGVPRGISGGDWLFYGAVAGVALAIGIVNALSLAQDATRRGADYDLRTPLIWELSS